VAKERRSIAEWQQDPAFVYLMNNMNLLLVGPARRATKEEPVYILTLGEATLKSRLHMNSMVNSLCRRLGEVIDTGVASAACRSMSRRRCARCLSATYWLGTPATTSS
jgi:hypothetical protein